jgi:hypothetical protein
MTCGKLEYVVVVSVKRLKVITARGKMVQVQNQRIPGQAE